MSRIDELRAALELPAMLALFGAESRGRRWGPCPVCSSADRRGTVTVDGDLWRCHACQAGGDALNLAALSCTGRLRPGSWAPVFAWAEDQGLLAARDGRQAAPPPPVVVEVQGLAHVDEPIPDAPEVLDADEADLWRLAWLCSRAVEAVRAELGERAPVLMLEDFAEAALEHLHREAEPLDLDAERVAAVACSVSGELADELATMALGLRVLRTPRDESVLLPRRQAAQVRRWLGVR